MDKDIQMILDKCNEELISWSEEHPHENMVVSWLGEGLPSEPQNQTVTVSVNFQR